MQVTKSKKALKDCYFNGLYSQMISETLPDALMIFEVKNGFYCAVDGDAWKIQTICPDLLGEVVSGDGFTFCRFTGDIDKILPRLVRVGERVGLCRKFA